MRNKKNCMGVLGTLLVAVVLVGCASGKSVEPLVWDDTLSDEQCATVYFHFNDDGSRNYALTDYNGVSLGTSTDKYGFVKPRIKGIKIPAGETTFTGVAAAYQAVGSGRVLNMPGIPLTYNFKAGRIYTINFNSVVLPEDQEEEEAHNNIVYTAFSDPRRKYNFRIYDGVAFVAGSYPRIPCDARVGFAVGNGFLPAGDGTYTNTKIASRGKPTDYLLATIVVDIKF